MVTIRLVEVTREKATYQYFVNGRGSPGVVCLHRLTGEREFTSPAPEDKGNIFAAHALKELERYNVANDFKGSGGAAWY